MNTRLLPGRGKRIQGATMTNPAPTASAVTDEQIEALGYRYLPTWDQDTIRFARAVLALAPVDAAQPASSSAPAVGGGYVPLAIVKALNDATGSNEWQGEASASELLEPAITAINALAAPAGAAGQDARSVACPHCWAKVGEPCMWPETRESNRDAPHKARIAALAAQGNGGTTA